MYYKLVDGKPVSCGLDELRQFDVALDRVGDYTVSTVFLGMWSGVAGDPKPFETMILGSGPRGYDSRRYATQAEAEVGHREVVESLR